MGFNSVYRTLQELFPQVDARILKAAAIEHPKDPDQAVESILTEILPYITKRMDTSRSMSRKLGSSQSEKMDGQPPLEVDSTGASTGQIAASTVESSPKHKLIAGGENNESQEMKGCDHGEATCFNESFHGPPHPAFHDASDIEDQLILLMNEESVMSEFCKERTTDAPATSLISSSLAAIHEEDTHGANELGIRENSEEHVSPRTCQPLDFDLNASYASCVIVNDDDADTFVSNGHISLDNYTGPSYLNYGKSVDLALLLIEDQIPIASDGTQKPSFENSVPVHDSVSPESKGGDDAVCKEVCVGSTLEHIIENARCHKKTLFSAMESVIGLMREVELKEKAVKEAKEAAAVGGMDILARVEELKRMLVHAQEANDMHAGEVYGEKAILATEMKELQSRLLGLSDETNNSLSVLDEMRHSLEGRLAAAEEDMNEAEREKLEKEESARISLAEQECVMEKVVQESKILQQEAEENAKLRDFLIDRGGIVDMLQGEISVICQDVKALKERFDNRIPLSRSFSSKETSCLLASSSSSQRSKASDQVSEASELFDSAKRMSRTPSVASASPSSSQRSNASYQVPEPSELFDSARRMSRTPSVASPSPSFHGQEGTGTPSDDDWEIFESES